MMFEVLDFSKLNYVLFFENKNAVCRRHVIIGTFGGF